MKKNLLEIRKILESKGFKKENATRKCFVFSKYPFVVCIYLWHCDCYKAVNNDNFNYLLNLFL
jgi:hypothetical protein